MLILFLGDIVGKPGVNAVCRHLPELRAELSLDLIIANGENAADGTGLTVRQYNRLIEAGVDCLTMGDHIYRKREIIEVLERDSPIVKPANYPPEAPGRRWQTVLTTGGIPVAVFSLLGRVYMRPVDCPFHAAEEVLEEIPDNVVVRVVDMHAEATSDKQLMGRFLDGRVSAVLGTHTHVPTDDTTILPGGTAFQCDVGMTGPYDSIIGRSYEKVLETTISFNPTQFHVATRDIRLRGALVDIDPRSGKATSIKAFERRVEK